MRSLILTALVAMLALAGCASPPPTPAPVEARTRPPAQVETPRPPARPAAAPAVRPAPAVASGVQTAPVRRSSVESRPLTEQDPSAAAANVRRDPKGLKRPYSEATLAEMRGSAATTPAAGATAATPAEPPSAPESRPVPAEVAPAFAWPARGRVAQGFSEPSHKGITITGVAGDPILAAADGKVIFAGPGPRGYGNLVIVKHESETLSVYAHNRAVLVKEGQAVKRGERIAEMGDTGADRVALHFEIRKDGKPVDPAKFLPPR